MLSPQQIETRLERILLKVQKPGRYVGGELNAVVKDWDEVKTRVAFIFPDIYDIGISNLGLQILYDLVNQRPDALAERAYAPWVDMEDLMRSNEIPLYSLGIETPAGGILTSWVSPSLMRLSTPIPSTCSTWPGFPSVPLSVTPRDPLDHRRRTCLLQP